MNAITAAHIAGGVVALLAGSIAVVARKGGKVHVAVGTGFCLAMFVLGITAAILAPLKSTPESPVGGIMVCYFVATAWMAARRRDGSAGRLEIVACAGVLLMAVLIAAEATTMLLAPSDRNAAPPGPFGLFALAAICGLAGIGDLRFVMRGTLGARQRMSRHLWRMCFAFFIATGSFFLGQQDVLPQAVRGAPVLLVLAFAPLALMLFWLVRVRVARAFAVGP